MLWYELLKHFGLNYVKRHFKQKLKNSEKHIKIDENNEKQPFSF